VACIQNLHARAARDEEKDVILIDRKAVRSILATPAGHLTTVLPVLRSIVVVRPLSS